MEFLGFSCVGFRGLRVYVSWSPLSGSLVNGPREGFRVLKPRVSRRFCCRVFDRVFDRVCTI